MSFDSLGRNQVIVHGSDRASLFDLAHVRCIYYPVCFRKNQAKVWALIDSKREVNVMTSAYTSKLGFKVRPTNVRTQINGSTHDSRWMTSEFTTPNISMNDFRWTTFDR